MKMFIDERRNKIMKLLQGRQRLTVKELASQLEVSEATLRSDLNKMESESLLVRTHGGAMLNDYIDYKTSFSTREKKNKKEKTVIANEAYQFITEKQCILLDASSTALELARYLSSQSIRLTVVTSGVQTALELKENPDITVIIVGGVVTKGSTSVEGTLGLSILDNINIDIMFTSANGFSVKKGLTDFNLYEVELKKEMVKRAKRVIALIDSSKIGETSSVAFSSTEEIDTIITDKAMREDISLELKRYNTHNVSSKDVIENG